MDREKVKTERPIFTRDREKIKIKRKTKSVRKMRLLKYGSLKADLSNL